MSRALSICGVILAAGESRRMGTDKALLPWPPANANQIPAGTFLSAAIRSFSPISDVVIVVVGKNRTNLEPVIYASGATLAINHDPDRGQFSSLQTGLQEVLNRGRDAAIVTLVDRPPVSPATIEKLHAAFGSAIARWKWALIPEYAGKHGHPIFLAREMMEEFLKAPATGNAREILHQNHEHIAYFEVDDPLVTVNVNTPDEYAALQRAVALMRE
jgi:molybdenum cofactor cytidylyltransferase